MSGTHSTWVSDGAVAQSIKPPLKQSVKRSESTSVLTPGWRQGTAMWEIRGLFGNEYAMEQAIEELKKHKGYEWEVLDRRNLSVRFQKRDHDAEEMVKRALEMYHGYAEHEGPLGEYDRERREEKEKKAKKEGAKQKLGK